MSKKVQTHISDKNSELINELIMTKDLVGYDGDYLSTVSAVCSYLIDLGLRVHLSSKDKNKFNINDYRYELFKRVLQAVQLNRSIISILNESEEFKNRDLIEEHFNKNIGVQNWIESEIGKFFVKDET